MNYNFYYLKFKFSEIVEVVKILHKNILNAASNLKFAHEAVQVRVFKNKKNYI